MPLLPMFACRLGPTLVTVTAGPVDAPPHIELLVLDIEGVGKAALSDALSTRLPQRRRIPSGNPAAREGVAMWGYVQLRPRRGGWTLALILSDGRGYYREVARREGGEDPRLIANTLSNLIASVEEDALPADEQDVAVPDEVAAPPVPPPLPERAPPHSAPPAPAVDPRFEIGPYIGGLVLLSAGPPLPSGFAGGGGELGLDVRLRAGATFGASLRAVGHASTSFGLARFRAGLHGGYAWRKGAFELLSLAGLSAEPWFVRANGSAQDARVGATALGGFVRLVPGYRRKTSDRLAIRVGPSIQVSGSSVLAAGGGVARVHDRNSPGREALFRVGGLEFSAGFEFGLWWAARPKGGSK